MARPYPVHTPLGATLKRQGWTVADFAAVSGVYSRTITEYLADRQPIREVHLDRFAAVLGVHPEEIV